MRGSCASWTVTWQSLPLTLARSIGNVRSSPGATSDWLRSAPVFPHTTWLFTSSKVSVGGRGETSRETCNVPESPDGASKLTRLTVTCGHWAIAGCTSWGPTVMTTSGCRGGLASTVTWYLRPARMPLSDSV